MKAYHFLNADMTARYGKEPSWTVGEERVWTGPLVFCKAGYHYGLTWYDALQNAPGSVACIVDVDPPERPDLTDGAKGVSRRRRLDAAYDVSRELCLWCCDCAERALEWERAQGREPDMWSWTALDVSRRYARGEVMKEELADIGATAWVATRDAGVTWAAWTAEIPWQRQRLAEILDAVVTYPKEVTR